MSTFILRDISDDPAHLTDAISDRNGFRGTVLSGIFVGSDNLEGLAVRLTRAKLSNGYDVLTEDLGHPLYACDFVCGGVGSEIIDEINA